MISILLMADESDLALPHGSAVQHLRLRPLSAICG